MSKKKTSNKQINRDEPLELSGDVSDAIWTCRTLQDLERLESANWFGPKLKRKFGPLRKMRCEFWGQRTVSLIFMRVFEHVLRIKKINPKEMCELLKSLTTHLKADVNRHIAQQRPPMGQGPVTDEETEAFTRQLEHVIDEIYGAKLQGV